MTTVDVLIRTALVAAVLFVAWSLVGCGGPPDLARDTTGAVVRVAHAFDVEATSYQSEMTEALIARLAADSSRPREERIAEVDAYLDSLEPLRRAVRAVRDGAYALEDSLRAWEAGTDGGDRSWQRAAACAFAALGQARRAVASLSGFALPAVLEQLLVSGAAFGQQLCDAGAGVTRSATGSAR